MIGKVFKRFDGAYLPLLLPSYIGHRLFYLYKNPTNHISTLQSSKVVNDHAKYVCIQANLYLKKSSKLKHNVLEVMEMGKFLTPFQFSVKPCQIFTIV